MRFLIASATALALLLVSSAAGAYELRLQLQSGSNDPANIAVGDTFVYELYLDTQAQSEITLFSVSFAFDPTIVQYNSANSANNSYYPLYSPGSGKTDPPSWLEPVPFDGNNCTIGDPLCSNPPVTWAGNLPPLGGQINFDFIVSTFPSGVTAATATNLLISQVEFEAVGAGSFTPEFSFDYGGNVFSINGDDIKDNTTGLTVAATLVDGGSVSVPEPGLAGLALGALGTVGFLASRRRRS